MAQQQSGDGHRHQAARQPLLYREHHRIPLCLRGPDGDADLFRYPRTQARQLGLVPFVKGVQAPDMAHAEPWPDLLNRIIVDLGRADDPAGACLIDKGSIGLAQTHCGQDPISLWRPHRMLNSGTDQSKPMSRNKLWTKPAVSRACRSAAAPKPSQG